MIECKLRNLMSLFAWGGDTSHLTRAEDASMVETRIKV